MCHLITRTLRFNKPMKSFKQFNTQINELFDRPARWRLVKDTGNIIKYRSSINDKNLVVFFHRHGISDDTSSKWEVSFTVDGDFSTTGGGDEIKVFSTVLDIMKDVIETKNPEELSFTAEKSLDSDSSNSRIRLYSRLIKRFAVSHGYQLVDKNDRGWKVVYKLVRI